MAYTIAQTAGKRASSGWQRQMPTDFDHAHPGKPRPEEGHRVPLVTIASTLHDDPRLVAGAGVIAFHAAEQAGLTEPAQEHLSAATMQACGEVFGAAQADAKPAAEVNVTASRFTDRIEIAVVLSHGEAHPGEHSKRTHVHDGERSRKPLDEGLVDRVERATHDGRPAIVLVKYFHPAKSKA